MLSLPFYHCQWSSRIRISFSSSSFSCSSSSSFQASTNNSFSLRSLSFSIDMAMKAAHVSDVPNLDHIQQQTLYNQPIHTVAVEKEKVLSKKFVVIGHRGSGMNILQSSDPRMKSIKENSILSFNYASKFSVDFIEFDVQVSKDGCPIIFHDDVILSEENGTTQEKRVTDLSLSEFLSYGPQREPGKVGKPLLRKTSDGKILRWDVEKDDFLCTLEETFQKVDSSLGFNIELKFDDDIVYHQQQLIHALEAVLKVVFEHGKSRHVLFSSFQPDAALLMKKLQGTYPVFFLTNGGNEIYNDERRNSLEEALKLSLEGGLEGIVSEAKGIFKNPGAVSKIKEAKLSLLTYGKLNNVPEAVYLQHLMGVDGVIVDLVQEISESVSQLITNATSEEEKVNEEILLKGREVDAKAKPHFSERELSFLLKLIPKLIHV